MLRKYQYDNLSNVFHCNVKDHIQNICTQIIIFFAETYYETIL